ncbi:branched-chain amino acid ABC transporter permease [Natrarchaeobaculum sulfurireducens]|uniref:ABC-type branched-chain amino acid transport system, permease component n=1 Tax=Natrarchaeobaculum sulfurireducens TaxID=2044521 RepID=A0A346P9M3_9EURY|nr:branched-chain amino acid ABC transporter permease [Natrarchaeobaculum sulfurireducens]AXR76218.1 branched-chain amino acid ABC transporter permease [Natrarchaeobaculum sulfurireducens]AXR79877.1 ABC-type branched-chain amino acid transport system, permease component [Natrarchaeobaculum sulfurireducens]
MSERDSRLPEPISNAHDRLKALPQWQYDLVLIVGVVLVTYGAFAILGFFGGVGINSIVGFFRTVTFYAAVYALVVLALNLHWGYTGLFNIGVAGFMAVGVYTMAFLTAAPDATPAGLGLPIPIGILGGMIAAGLVGLVAALPALRVRADYFAIVTLGLSEIIRLALLSGSLRSIEVGDTVYGTGGGSGIQYPPVDTIIPWLLERPVIGELGEILFEVGGAVGIQRSVILGGLYTAVLIAFVGLFYLFLSRIANSPYGRILKAIREDELAAKSLGKNTDRAKIVAFVVGCSLMGLAGMLWMGSRSFVSPDSFMPIITFYIFVALIVGGAGSNTGSVIGGFAFAAFLWEGPRFVRSILNANLNLRSPPTIYDAFVELASGDLTPLVGYLVGSLDELRFVLVGVVLILLMLWRPEGLLGHRKEIAAATDLSKRPSPPDRATASDGGEPDE